MIRRRIERGSHYWESNKVVCLVLTLLHAAAKPLLDIPSGGGGGGIMIRWVSIQFSCWRGRMGFAEQDQCLMRKSLTSRILVQGSLVSQSLAPNEARALACHSSPLNPRVSGRAPPRTVAVRLLYQQGPQRLVGARPLGREAEHTRPAGASLSRAPRSAAGASQLTAAGLVAGGGCGGRRRGRAAEAQGDPCAPGRRTRKPGRTARAEIRAPARAEPARQGNIFLL